MPIILIGVAALLLLGLGQQYRSIENTLTFNFVKFRFGKGSLLSLKIFVEMQIQNRGQLGARITAFDGLIKLDGLVIGNLITENEINIRPRSNSIVNLVVQTDNIESLKILYRSITSKRIPKIEIDGGFHTDLFGRIPYQYTYFEGKQINKQGQTTTQQGGANV